MTSENVLPNHYRDIKDAIKVAGQIRRASLLTQDEKDNWRVLIINNRHQILNDLQEMNLPEKNSFVHINDGFGMIKRIKSQLNFNDTLFLAKVLSSYNSTNNDLSQEYNDLSQKIKKFVIKVQEIFEEPKPVVSNNRSGIYDIKSKLFNYYYKTFQPNNIQIEQIISENNYDDFILYLSINNKESLSINEPAFRKSKISIEESYNHVSQNKNIRLKLQLKEKSLSRIRGKMFDIKEAERLFELKSPVGKYILTDISNYDLIDIDYL